MDNGYVFERLDGSGNAIYFFHNINTTNGSLEVGIVTGLDESSYPSGTFYPLYQNANLAGTVSGYNKSDTTGATFTFGVSGFDIYAKFNGVQFMTFKEYRQMSVGAVALKANTGAGFRAITFTPEPRQFLLSNYSAGQLNLADFNVRSIQTTGSITSGSNSLTVASSAGFQVGDWVIVEIGTESGAGALGTMGVGGSWPAKNYASTAAMNADHTQATNTFAWPSDTGAVNRWNGTSWTTSWPSTFYTQNAVPMALHGRISNIVGNVLTLTQADLSTAQNASATATSANVYLDIQPYINYLVGDQNSGFFLTNLRPITPSNVSLILPAGTFGASGTVSINSGSGWSITGQGAGTTILYSPKGAFGIGVAMDNATGTYSGDSVSSLTITGNWGLSGYMFQIAGWSYVAGGFNAAGVMNQNDAGGAYITQTSVAAVYYPFGVRSRNHNNATISHVAVSDVPQTAIGADDAVNVNASNVTVTMNAEEKVEYWPIAWANTAGGGCTDCTFNSPTFMHLCCETFQATGHSFIRPVITNGFMSENTSDTWTISSGTITIKANSGIAFADIHNPIININNNEGGSSVACASACTISNTNITQQGYIDANNDTYVGITVNVDNPNVTISGGTNVAPNYASPSTLAGPVGVSSTGTNTQVTGYKACGTVHGAGEGNIIVSNGGVNSSNYDSRAGVGGGSGNITPCP